MRKNFLFISMIVLMVITGVVLVLSCVHMFIDPNYNMGSWLMVFVLANFAVIMIIGIVLEKFHLRKIGFYALHIGLVLVLIGSFMYFLKGQNYTMTFPVDNTTYYTVTPTTEDGEKLDLLMDIKITEAVTEYYSPTYSVYDVNTETGEMELIEGDLEIIDGYLDLGPYGGTNMSEAELNASLSSFTNPTTGATSVYYYITSTTAVIQNITPSHYEAKFVLASAEYEEYYGSEDSPLILTVNHPVYKGGWKIYLMAVSGSGNAQYVTLMFKKDPGEIVTLIGIVLLVAGSFISAFMPTGKPKEKKEVNTTRKGVAK